MHIPQLSVRFRLLGLCLGLLVIFGSASLLLGYLIQGNQAVQEGEQEQYRRLEVIEAVQQAIGRFRHMGGELNSAILRKDAEQEKQARAGLEQAQQEVGTQLKRLSAFNAQAAQTITTAMQEAPQYSERIMNAMAAGRQAEAAPLSAELYRRLNLIEDTLRDAAARERASAEQTLHEAKTQAALAIRLAIFMIVAAGASGLLLVLVVGRSIIRPLRITTDAIRQVNAGELEIDLPPISGDEFGQTALALRQFRDNAEKLRRLAYQDTLTGLGNRARLQEALEAALQRQDGDAARVVLFYFDLDNFRSVNDRFGHKAGDIYLCEAASRLQRFLPAEAELYRYSGDKFIAVLEDDSAAAVTDLRLRTIADNVLRGVSEPFRLGSHLLHMSVSVGIAASPSDGLSAEHLISSAEAAGHAAKRSGRNNARFAGGQLAGLLRRQAALAGEIRRGLEQGEFEVFYQPVVNVEHGRVYGAEALLRWRHPERGLLLPGEFIQVAEEEGLITAVGERCLRLAHAQIKRWRSAGLAFRVAVNLSARQLLDDKVLQLLIELRTEDLQAAAQIDLELTESVLFDSSEHIRRMLEEIRRTGYRLAMDDFGTGYSSFAYLRRLPIDRIKIDRQFVADLGLSRQAEGIVSAMLALARKLELEVVAEGVETPLQAQLLQSQGCFLQQGFLYSRALAARDFERWAEAYPQGPQGLLAASL